MYFKQADGVELGFFDHLSSCGGALHYVSTRRGGVSEGAFGSLNLSYKSGDSRENVNENRRRLAQSLSIETDRLVFAHQTHSANVRIVDRNTSADQLQDTDAMITSEPGVCISVMVADCVPVLLFDPEAKVVAAIHAGWRGTVAEITGRTIDRMKAHFGVKPERLLAGIGPSISPSAYEVGEEVIEKAEAVFGRGKGLIKTAAGNKDKRCFDLWLANKIQLLDKGAAENLIETAGICTYQNPEQFFSARKLSPASGRFAAGIMIRS